MDVGLEEDDDQSDLNSHVQRARHRYRRYDFQRCMHEGTPYRDRTTRNNYLINIKCTTL